MSAPEGLATQSMKLSQRQIEMLQRSARDPVRPPPAGRSPDGAATEKERLFRALEDALWAMGHADAAPARRSAGVPAAAAARPVTDWQPIATAPQERDVEVRVHDQIGHYRLLYPCRLVPGIGWINVLAKRELTAEPVEWRDWQEEMPDFR